MNAFSYGPLPITCLIYEFFKNFGANNIDPADTIQPVTDSVDVVPTFTDIIDRYIYCAIIRI